MKITKRQLRRLIREEIAHPRHDLGKNIADAEFPIVVGYNLRGSDQSEIAYNQDELDDILDMIAGGPGSSANIPYSLDSLEDMEPSERPAGASIERYAEGVIAERGTGNPALRSEEQAIMRSVVAFVDKYRLENSMDPNDFGDDKRVRQAVQDVIASVLGEDM